MKIPILVAVFCVAAILGMFISGSTAGGVSDNGVQLLNGAMFSNGAQLANGAQLINGMTLQNGAQLVNGISAPGNSTLSLMELASRPLARKD